jgi:site-specific recombinase XerC
MAAEGKMLLSQAIRGFIVAITAEGRCQECTRDAMTAFLAHAGDIELERLSTKTMRTFLASEFARRRANRRAISTADMVRRFYAVRLFIAWLVRQGIIQDFTGLKLDRKRPELLSKEISKKIFRHSKWCRKTFYAVRPSQRPLSPFSWRPVEVLLRPKVHPGGL